MEEPILLHHDRIEDAEFRRAVDLLDAGDTAALRLYLEEHPDMVRRRVTFGGTNYFCNPTLLEFVAENPVRHGTLPANIVAVAEVILDVGVTPAALNETLRLVSSGRVARECGVQLPLIDLLCGRGADPASAMRTALAHGEFEAANALLVRGAPLDLSTAAALGLDEDVSRLLLAAGADQRHLALALAAQFGHEEIVRTLLDAGEHPDRYNPPGAHCHSTPLHQAAYAGHDGVVRLLVERGARLDLRDTEYEGIPADWAYHGGRKQIEAWLREQETQRSGRATGDEPSR